MKIPAAIILLLFQALPVFAVGSNSVVNLSHYDLMRPDFASMKDAGIVGVIHEATFPRLDRDTRYRERQEAAMRAGLLWGAYHFGDATNPIRQADHFLNVVEASLPHTPPEARPASVLLVLDFEKNGHYPGGTMRADQAAAFVERIRERTGNYPGVYCSEYRIRQMLGGSSASSAAKRSLTNCWLWIANYHYEPRTTAPWSHWQLWQYTGDGKCDLPRALYPKSVANIRKAERNIFRGSRASLETFWQEHAWRPAG
jgi:lysozyme